jgi:hypothetical protein
VTDYTKDFLINAAQQAASRHGVDPGIFTRMINQESGFNTQARSPAGALGIAQFMPATAQGFGIDPMDPMAALDAAARYIKNGLSQFDGSYPLALAAYNAGAGAVRKYGGIPPYKETQNYVRSILGGTTPTAASPTPQAQAPSTVQKLQDNPGLSLALINLLAPTPQLRTYDQMIGSE